MNTSARIPGATFRSTVWSNPSDLNADAPYGGLCVAYFNGDYPTALDDYEADFLKSLTPEDRVRLPEFALYKSKYIGNEYDAVQPDAE